MDNKFKEVILLKYGELILKGLNKSYFESLLLKDINRKIAGCGNFTVEKAQSTVYVIPQDDNAAENIDMVFSRMKKVFGIVSLCKSACVEKNMQEIIYSLPKYTYNILKDAKTFKVEAKRSDKNFPLNSPQIARECGGVLLSNFHHLKVDVKNPDTIVYVEIRDYAAYIHCGSEEGAGGMPSGSSGKGLLLLSGGIDSPVAGYAMAKRGMKIESLHFESFPYTSEQARQKVIDLAEIMTDYCGSMDLNIVSVTHIQEELKEKCREEYFTLLLRRFMMRIAERIARNYKSRAIITGESLGQVASQTLDAMTVTNAAVSAEIPVFRPLIANDKEEIIKIARKIGTFETSILPFEDCCTVFTPRHPSTKPVLEKILDEESKIDISALVEEALASRTHLRLE